MMARLTRSYHQVVSVPARRNGFQSAWPANLAAEKVIHHPCRHGTEVDERRPNQSESLVSGQTRASSDIDTARRRFSLTAQTSPLSPHRQFRIKTAERKKKRWWWWSARQTPHTHRHTHWEREKIDSRPASEVLDQILLLSVSQLSSFSLQTRNVTLWNHDRFDRDDEPLAPS